MGNALADYPEPCRQSIQTVSEKIGVDHKIAYAMLSLEAVLYDMRPSDEQVLEMLLEDYAPCG